MFGTVGKAGASTMENSRVHDFRQKLAWGESKVDEPFWDTAYRSFFPSLVNHMPVTGNHASQRMGVDRIIYLSNDRVLRVEEKKREKAYSDIALEFIHTKSYSWMSQKVAEGWIERNLVIDYMAYAFIETKTVYIFDWLLLRRAWVANNMAWKQRYRIATAKNISYYSHSVCVPISVLQNALNGSSKLTIG